MSKIIASAKKLADEIEGLVILVHHSGKNRAQGLRGHSSLLAAMDLVIEVQKSAVGRSWRVAKAKDDSDDVQHDFGLVVLEVGQDADGVPLTSCAVQQTVHPVAPRRKVIAGKNQKRALAALSGILALPGQSVERETAVDHVATALPSTRRPGERAKEAVTALIAAGYLTLTDGKVALAP